MKKLIDLNDGRLSYTCVKNFGGVASLQNSCIVHKPKVSFSAFRHIVFGEATPYTRDLMPPNSLLELSRFFSEGLRSNIQQVQQHFANQRTRGQAQTGNAALLNASATVIWACCRGSLICPCAAQPDNRAPLASASISSHVTKETLGRSTWLLLHTMAAHYPDQPDKSQQKIMHNMVHTFCTQDLYCI